VDGSGLQNDVTNQRGNMTGHIGIRTPDREASIWWVVDPSPDPPSVSLEASYRSIVGIIMRNLES
jgi:hypothetical protein